MPSAPHKNTAIRFPDDIHDRLRTASEAFGLPINFLVVTAVREFLDRMIDPSEFRLTRPPNADGGSDA